MGMLGKIALLLMFSFGLNAWASESWGSSLTPGDAAPNFFVESGDNKTLSLDKIRGKVIVLFYENRHVTKQNKGLKDELTRLYKSQPPEIQNDIFRLVVIDCERSSWPAVLIWKRKLRENSVKEGFTIYGDWTGRMCAAYRMQEQQSNFLIIDKQGIIRYSATGKVAKSRFEKIIDSLFALVRTK